MQVRTLRVIQDRLIIGIGSGRVNFAGHAFARKIAILCVEFVANRARHALEIFWSLEIESSIEESAMLVELLIQLFAVAAHPLG